MGAGGREFESPHPDHAELVSQGRLIVGAGAGYLEAEFQTTVEWAREAMDVITSELAQSDRPAELGPLEITMTPVGPFDRAVRDQYEALGVDRLVFLPGLDADAGHRHDPVPSTTSCGRSIGSLRR